MNEDELKMELSKYNPPEKIKKIDASISFYYLIVLLLIGVPMWYFTTTTYRASLPISDIHKFSNSEISMVIKINLINFDGKVEMDDLFLLQDKLLQELQKNKKGKFVKCDFTGYVRQATKAEMEIYQYGKQLLDLDQITNKLSTNDIYILLIPSTSFLLSSYKKGVIRSKSDRNVLVLPFESIKLVQETILRTLTELLVRNDDLNVVYEAAQHVPEKESLNSIPNRVRSILTRVRTAAKYEWTFSLIVPRPKGGSSTEWNFPHLEHLYLEPLIRKLAPFVSIKVSSQIIYGVLLEQIWPPKYRSQNRRAYTREDLTHVVNGIETYLDSNNGLNFVGYIASSKEGEPGLHLDGQSGGVDAFTIPRWGGVVLMNNVSLPIDDDALMGIFLPQISSLMGISRPIINSIIPFEEFDVPGIPVWQIDNWLRHRTIENLAITRVTLNSILILLDKVVNMVIRDDVAAHIRLAVNLSLNSLAALKSTSDNSLQIAFLSSKQALEAAETAFFDPSLLELLYFQDDQKIGIYIPLFVPVLLPVILTALKVKPYLLSLLKRKSE